MNESFKFHILLLLLAILFATRSNGESSACVTVYKEGGAPAVFQSPKCPRWTLSNYGSTVTITTTTTTSIAPCQSAILQGRQKSPVGFRILCAPRYSHPFSWILFICTSTNGNAFLGQSIHCHHFNKVIQAERMQWSRFFCEKYDNFKVASSNYVKELTRDHHPDRGGERIRVETAGGYVLELGGVPQLNGQLAIS